MFACVLISKLTYMKKLFRVSIKKLRLLFIPVLLTSIACSSDNSIKADYLNENDSEKYDENNYEFNTIQLWGSELAVVDCGDYYKFQGDIHL